MLAQVADKTSVFDRIKVVSHTCATAAHASTPWPAWRIKEVLSVATRSKIPGGTSRFPATSHCPLVAIRVSHEVAADTLQLTLAATGRGANRARGAPHASRRRPGESSSPASNRPPDRQMHLTGGEHQNWVESVSLRIRGRAPDQIPGRPTSRSKQSTTRTWGRRRARPHRFTTTSRRRIPPSHQKGGPTGSLDQHQVVLDHQQPHVRHHAPTASEGPLPHLSRAKVSPLQSLIQPAAPLTHVSTQGSHQLNGTPPQGQHIRPKAAVSRRGTRPCTEADFSLAGVRTRPPAVSFHNTSGSMRPTGQTTPTAWLEAPGISFSKGPRPVQHRLG